MKRKPIDQNHEELKRQHETLALCIAEIARAIQEQLTIIDAKLDRNYLAIYECRKAVPLRLRTPRKKGRRLP
jgi:hypothetical protein